MERYKGCSVDGKTESGLLRDFGATGSGEDIDRCSRAISAVARANMLGERAQVRSERNGDKAMAIDDTRCSPTGDGGARHFDGCAL